MQIFRKCYILTHLPAQQSRKGSQQIEFWGPWSALQEWQASWAAYINSHYFNGNTCKLKTYKKRLPPKQIISSHYLILLLKGFILQFQISSFQKVKATSQEDGTPSANTSQAKKNYSQSPSMVQDQSFSHQHPVLSRKPSIRR